MASTFTWSKPDQKLLVSLGSESVPIIKLFYNLNKLTTAILSDMEGIKSETLLNLVNLMPKRCI